MSGLLEGRRVIVAGVGPGLGRAAALAAARHGADVAIAARSADTLEAVADEIRALGRRALPVPTDLTRDGDCDRLVERTVDELGGVEGLVSNAFAMPPFEPLVEQSLDTIRDSLEINLFATLRLARAAAPPMQRAGGGSVVVTLSSVLRQVRHTFGAYKIAKHGLLGMARSLAGELGPRGIRVNSLAPGYVGALAAELDAKLRSAWTGEAEDAIHARIMESHMLRRVPEPEEIAGTMVYLLSDLAGVVTGQCIDVNAGEFQH